MPMNTPSDDSAARTEQTRVVGRTVFLSELDDDFQDVVGLTQRALARRIVCYYLLAPHVVLHPAYVWQSDKSHDMVHRIGKEILRPPFTRLELGLHPSIQDYMGERIRQLRVPGYSTRELRSYESYSDLDREAKDLSVRFDTAEKQKVSTYDRDAEFKRRLSVDAGNLSSDGDTLGELLGTVRLGRDGVEATTFGDALQRFVAKSELVSVDSVLREIADRGKPELAASPLVQKRILGLYYGTYTDEGIVIPGTNKLAIGSVIDPYDSDLFWQAASDLFGSSFLALSDPSQGGVGVALRGLREDSYWVEFVASYLNIIATADDAIQRQPEEVLARLRSLNPGRSRNYILQRLWYEHKWPLASLMFGLITAPAATGALIVGSGSAQTLGAATLAGVAVAGRDIRSKVRYLASQFQEIDGVRLRNRVHEHVTSVLLREELGDDG